MSFLESELDLAGATTSSFTKKMIIPNYMTVIAFSMLLFACDNKPSKSGMKAEATSWQPGIYTVSNKEDGISIGIVLQAEKKMQFYAGEEVLAEYWTRADAPTEVFIAERDGGLYVGDGKISLLSRDRIGRVVITKEFSNFSRGSSELVVGTIDDQVPFGVRLVPTTTTEHKAINNGEQAAPRNH